MSKNSAHRLMSLKTLPILPTIDVIQERREELDAIGKQIARTRSRLDSEYEMMRTACPHDDDVASVCKVCRGRR